MAVLVEMGLEIGHERFEGRWQPLGDGVAGTVAVFRRRLGVGPGCDQEIEALTGPDVLSSIRRSVTIWWAP